MKRLIRLSVGIFCIISPIQIFSQIDYLGQTPPGSEPEIFAPGIISIPGRNERALAFDPAGRDLFFTEANWPNSKIFYMRRDSSGWTTPEIASFSAGNGSTEPSFASDGNTLYYASNRGNSSNDYDLWKVSRNDSGWAEPVNLGGAINVAGREQYHPCVVDNANLYFASGVTHAEIFVSRLENGAYTAPENLGPPINTTSNDWDPYLPPDESYIIFRSNRPGGYGNLDGYISFKENDGTWSDPINLGPIINTSSNDDVGDVSPDGKHLFFARNSDIYWVSASIIDSLKTVFANPNPGLVIQPDSLDFDSTQTSLNFYISNPGTGTLDWSVSDDSDWIKVSPSSGNTTTETDEVTVTADTTGLNPGSYFGTVLVTSNGGEAAVSVSITIPMPVSVELGHTQPLPEEFALGQNYPNPFNPSTTIKYILPESCHVLLKVYDVVGKEMETLVNEFQTIGAHEMTWQTKGLSSGVYFYTLKAGGFSESKKLLLLK